MDRRMVKTRNDIKEAFIRLVQEKSIDSISVKDITQEADINRTTFYKHFEDKFDMLAVYEEEILQKIDSMIGCAEPLESNRPFEEQSAFHTIVQVYRYIQDERNLVEALIGPNGNPSFLQHLQYLLEKNLSRNILNYVQRKKTIIPEELVVVYLASAHMGMIRHWLTKKLAYTPEEMAYMLMSILSEGPFKAAGLSGKADFAKGH